MTPIDDAKVAELTDAALKELRDAAKNASGQHAQSPQGRIFYALVSPRVVTALIDRVAQLTQEANEDLTMMERLINERGDAGDRADRAEAALAGARRQLDDQVTINGLLEVNLERSQAVIEAARDHVEATKSREEPIGLIDALAAYDASPAPHQPEPSER